jgi:hypothetical protein
MILTGNTEVLEEKPVTGKFAIEQATKAHRGSRFIALLIL